MFDNICAIATPAGTGGIAIIRISGDSPKTILKSMFKPFKNIDIDSFEPYKLYPGEINAGEIIDYAMCVYFEKPHSFTGEDTIEIHCHGGIAITAAILRRAVELGCRIAQNGEFTKRAFLNGKLSLASCEGLINIINSESSAQLKAAYSLYREKLTKRTQKIQNALTSILAEIDANIDFPEDDISPYKVELILEKLALCNKAINKITATYADGSRIKNGINVAIIGRPNTGKSSLLNALIAADKAIVTDIAGTTRDIVEASLIINGVKFNLYDTAGIRESTDSIEKIGIELSKKALEAADVVVFVLDATTLLTPEDYSLQKLLSGKNIITVYNKTDKKEMIKTGGVDLLISAKTGQNIDQLKQLLYNKTVGKIDLGGDILVEERHYHAYINAARHLQSAIDAINIMPLDVISVDIKAAWQYLGEISGETAAEHIISEIFAKFCVGK